MVSAVVLMTACTTDVKVADDVGIDGDGGGSTGGSTGVGDTGGGPTGSGEGPSDGSSEGPSDGSGEGTDTGGGIKLDVGGDGTSGEPEPVGCIGGNDLIWVLVLNDDKDRRPELHRFDPEDPGFEWRANLECLPVKSVGDNPLSLAVGRDGRALLALRTFEGIDQGPKLYDFDLFADDPCATLEITPWTPPSSGNSLSYMALDPEVPEDETLFVHSNIAQAFGEIRFDLPILTVDYLGESPYPYMTLTGTADGRIFAIGGEQSWLEGDLVELEPATGGLLEVFMPTDSGAHPAFYGGDLLLFELNQQAVGWAPRVLRFDLDDDDGSGEQELTEIYGEADDPPNLWIRGVASPTCIPATPEG